MAPVFAKLENLGVEPLGVGSQPDIDNNEPLVERVRRRAEALRAEWLKEKVMAGQTDEGNDKD